MSNKIVNNLTIECVPNYLEEIGVKEEDNVTWIVEYATTNFPQYGITESQITSIKNGLWIQLID